MAEVGLSWMHSGGLHSVPVCRLADVQTGCFKAASRTPPPEVWPPLSFSEDGRGRLHATLVVERYPLYLGYVTESAALSTVLFKAERLAVLSRAAVVELDPWLSQQTRKQWNDPLSGEGVADESATSYFPATQRDLAVLGQLRVLFPLQNTRRDRKLASAEEVMAGPVRLPYATRLTRFILPKGKALWIGKRELSNCIYLFKVNERSLPRQVIRARLPRSWFHDVDNKEADEPTDFEQWQISDLGLKAGEHGCVAANKIQSLAVKHGGGDDDGWHRSRQCSPRSTP
eukprot:4763031-Amphidinium_carterae.2